MFLGGSSINLDAKGRLALPTRYRAMLVEHCQGRMVLSVQQDGGLLLYPYPEWQEIEFKITNLPNQDRRVRQLQRMMLGYATEVEMDGQGRILIAPRLRSFAKLEKRVELLGQGNKFEIFNEAMLDQECEDWKNDHQDDKDLPDALDNLSL